ncbi:MAG: NADH:ubiquinone oxidoreductase subunit N [Acidithiobacillales bacterium SG8_45]|jgi:NADH-quinone oxidoreductase subunit N|nr:MAG: NADH:ubiquinone oxidoreductase subunit N [Acidithiobacillales bacterium SG8_45]
MTFEIPNFTPAIPEIFVLTMACVILMVDLLLTDRSRVVSYLLAQATLVGAALLTLAGMSTASVSTFSGMYVQDPMGDMLKLVMYLAVFIAFVYSRDYIQLRNMFRGEYFVLGLFGLLGMMVMVSASHFLTIYLGLELLSLSLYTMVAMNRDSGESTEAAMKYFVLGAIASGMLLYGMSMLYGATGTLEIAKVKAAISLMSADNIILVFGLVFIVVGLAFKVGAVPFHMWVPDVYHGAPTSVALYISSAPKIAAFAMIMRLLVGGLDGMVASWQGMLIILAILSMGLGNLIAISQTNIKRMLAYSAISHMGFFLLGILSGTDNGYASAMFYVLVYAVMSLGGFGIIILLSRQGFEADSLDDFKGLARRSPWVAFLMLLMMLSMAGVPPMVGFYAKLMVVQSVIDAGLLWLAVVAVLMAVIGAYYYLRVIKLMYFDQPESSEPIAAGADMRAVLSINALALLLVLPWVGTLIDLCRKAIQAVA